MARTALSESTEGRHPFVQGFRPVKHATNARTHAPRTFRSHPQVNPAPFHRPLQPRRLKFRSARKRFFLQTITACTGTPVKYNESKLPFKQMENIGKFVAEACHAAPPVAHSAEPLPRNMLRSVALPTVAG